MGRYLLTSRHSKNSAVRLTERANKRKKSVPLKGAHTRHVGASHVGSKLNMWSQEHMLAAINEYNQAKSSNDQKHHGLRAIARAWSVPYETFRKRVTHSLSHLPLSGRPTVLPKDAEEQLAGHISLLASVGFPCTRADVRNLAYEYAKLRGITGFSKQKNCAGYYWLQGFLNRFPHLNVKRAENLSAPRAMAMNKVQVQAWFAKYKELATGLDIIDHPSHLWNFDETGCQNIHTASEVVGNRSENLATI